MSALKSDVNNPNSGAKLMALSRSFIPNFAITGGTRAKGAAHLRINRLLMENVSFEIAIKGTSLQNLGVGTEGLPFGVSQQIDVTKWLMREAVREECGTK